MLMKRDDTIRFRFSSLSIPDKPGHVFLSNPDTRDFASKALIVFI